MDGDRLSEAAVTPTLKLAFIATLATLAYLGLAVLGWDGFSAFFFRHARIALTITLLVLAGEPIRSATRRRSQGRAVILRSGKSAQFPFLRTLSGKRHLHASQDLDNDYWAVPIPPSLH
jgi:hypothetical protein